MSLTNPGPGKAYAKHTQTITTTTTNLINKLFTFVFWWIFFFSSAFLLFIQNFIPGKFLWENVKKLDNFTITNS